MPDKAAVLQTEFSMPFIQSMQNAMIVSFYKYGPVAEGAQRFSAVENIKVRLKRYEETGNADYLVDVANFAMIEFMAPRHPNAHFKMEDSAASPGRIRADDGKLVHETNDGGDLKAGISDKSRVGNMRAMLDKRGYGGEG